MVRKGLTGGRLADRRCAIADPGREAAGNREIPDSNATTWAGNDKIRHVAVHCACLLRRQCCLTSRRRASKLRPVHAPSDHKDSARFTPDSRLAWVRLAVALAIGSIGSVGMWSVVVVAAGGAGRIRRHARRGFAGLYPHHGGFRRRRRRDRADHRPFRHRHGDGAQHRFPRLGLHPRRTFHHAVAVQCRVFPDRARHVGDLRAADGGSLALVRALSRTRGDHRRQRQLHRRHVLAAADHLRDFKPSAGAPPISPSAFSARSR